MEYRKLGKSDLSVSLIGLGCNNFSGRIDIDTSKLVIEKSLELGINFFDTADVYGGKHRCGNGRQGCARPAQ